MNETRPGTPFSRTSWAFFGLLLGGIYTLPYQYFPWPVAVTIEVITLIVFYWLATGSDRKAKRMAHIEIERPDDETMIILVGGVEIATITHDEHGSAGMEAAEQVARGIGSELYIDVEEK